MNSENNVSMSLFMLNDCMVCSLLETILDDVISFSNYRWELRKFKLKHRDDLHEIGLNVRLFPTLFAYKNNKLRLGWEGFAALAPDEIKREMVEDVLRQVAALADEVDGDVTH